MEEKESDRRQGHAPGNVDTYSDVWDRYVDTDFPRILTSPPPQQRPLKTWQVLNTEDSEFEWPGDEWGSRRSVDETLSRVLWPFLKTDAPNLAEIGSGAGRYTKAILERFPNSSVSCFDISERFIASLKARCAKEVDDGRLSVYRLSTDPQFISRQLSSRSVDAFISFDAMVHVDVHTLAMYLLNGADVLVVDGIVSMNVADMTNEYGMLKLLHDAPGVYSKMGRPGGHFQWLSPVGLSKLLELMGFEVELMESLNGRDLFFVARLVHPGRHLEALELARAINR